MTEGVGRLAAGVPVDPEVVALLDRQQAQGFPGYRAVGPRRAREVSKAVSRWRAQAAAGDDDVASVADVDVPGAGPVLRARVYRPAGEVVGQVLYFHGGGFVVGDLDTCDAHCRAIAARAGTIVTSVDYSLAPEHPYPVAVHEGVRALRWVCGAGGPAAGAPVAVAGDSAGGNLATSILLSTSDDPAIDVAAQLLLYPMLDPTMSSPSLQEASDGYVLDRATIEWFWSLYLAGDETRADRSLLSARLDGMPPAIVVTAGYDPLRDEGQSYARRLEAAGVPTTSLCYACLVHGFFGWSAHVTVARAAVSEVCAALREVLLAAG